MQRKIICSVIILIAAFYACGRKPGGVLSEEKMVTVLTDIRLAQAIYRNDYKNFNDDLKKDALIEGILQKHKVTQAELDSSLYWYSDNIDIYRVINDSVASRLRTKSNLLTSSRQHLMSSKIQNRANAILPPIFYLNEQTPTMSFNIDSTKIKTIDLPNFQIRFDVQGISKNQKIEAAVFFAYTDTIVKKVLPINQNMQYVFNKPELADSLLNNITGYIHMSSVLKGIPSTSNILLYNIKYENENVDRVDESEGIINVRTRLPRKKQNNDNIVKSVDSLTVQE